MTSRNNRSRKNAARRKTRKSTRPRTPRAAWWLVHKNPATLGAVFLVVAILGFAVFATVQDSRNASRFQIDVYQGEEVLGGSSVRFSDVLAQQKPVVLNFWGGSCPPCRFEMPDIQRVYERRHPDVVFLGLDVGSYLGLGTRSTALSLLDQLGITYPAGTPLNRSPLASNLIRSLPVTLFFDRQGRRVRRWDGAITEDQLDTIVGELLNQS